ncbi:MAG: hypothetical protein WC655_16660 [Candidatus Hydrogenedentales bacterium]|jgi:hypothetical protein
MLKESTIRKQMERLFRAHEHAKPEDYRAYDMATALQWVLGGCTWSPMSLVGETKKEKR